MADTQNNPTEPINNNNQQQRQTVNKPARPTSLHDITGKQIASPILSPTSPNDTVNNNNNNNTKPARPTSLHSGINTMNTNNNIKPQPQVLPSTRPLSSTQSMKHKTNKPSSSDNHHQQSTINFKRRQSLPTNHTNNRISSSNSTNLKVPGSSSTYAVDLNDDQDFDLSSSSSRRYQYNGPAVTPLLTPALSISSLVSSLDGSMENLNIQDGGGENYFYFDDDKSPNDPNVSMATRKLHFTFEMANRDEIVNNRLKYFFNTLDTEQYYETHNGKDIGPTTPAQ